MRVLVTTHPLSGHFHPLLPIARALRSAGHEVAFATAPDFAPVVERLGFAALPAGRPWEGDPELAALRVELLGHLGPDSPALALRRLFIGWAARHALADLQGLMRAQRPEILLHEVSEFAGPLAERPGRRRDDPDRARLVEEGRLADGHALDRPEIGQERRAAGDAAGPERGARVPEERADVAAGHDRAVAVDRVMAVHAGHEGRPAHGRQPAQREPADPGRQARVNVHYVGPFRRQPVCEPAEDTEEPSPLDVPAFLRRQEG